MNAVCGDNRFEIIAKVKEHLVKATNIEMQPEELKYADNVLFRLWQLGYFDSVEKISRLEELVEDLKSDHEYNLGLMKGLNEKIAELNKANEWHFVSKEGFPDKDDIYLIIRKDGLHLGDYCCGGDGAIDCQSWCDYPSEEEIQDDSVIAWKEIVLPELKECKE